jgi:glycine/D-amino acid oxidase-like deaminating enzyme/nitrite reductase/ring-hydroxylating ferredoxin subunit
MQESNMENRGQHEGNGGNGAHQENLGGERPAPWEAGVEAPRFDALTTDAQADVVVVGAGIAGMTTAYLLAREGKQVIVLDHGPVGAGATGRTTAHLSWAIDDRFYEMVRLHGADGARIAGEAHRTAVDLIESIATKEQIDCDFKRLDGYLFLAPEHRYEELDRELKAIQKAGLSGVEPVERTPYTGVDLGPALRFSGHGRFHPMKYLRGLADAIQRMGGRIHSGTHVTNVKGGRQVVVTTRNGHQVTAGAVVVATNSPINDLVITHVKQAPYRTWAIAMRVPKGAVADALYWDTLSNYHYIRLQELPDSRTEELLIVGGEDNKVGSESKANERWQRLEEWTRAHFPMATSVEYRWSGMVLETIDGLAFIGKTPAQDPNVYIATGDSGMGITHGTIAGILLSDLITKGTHPWAELFDPLRLRMGALPTMAMENLGVATQFARHVTPAEVSSPEEVLPGTGALMKSGLSKVALYRDDDGTLHKMSASCTHLGCIVSWNSAEKLWECGCHGSRFDRHGEVVNGPAATNLPVIETAAERK